MIEQERRDRELALRLAQDPDAVDTEAQQVSQMPLQRCADNFICINRPFQGFYFSPRSSVVFMPCKGSDTDILRPGCERGEQFIWECDCTGAGIVRRFSSSDK